MVYAKFTNESLRLIMKKVFLAVLLVLLGTILYSQKRDNINVTLFGKYNLHKKDISSSAKNYMKAKNTADFGFNFGYNRHIGKKQKFFLGLEGGIINTRYSFDFEPNVKELGFEKFSGANDFVIKTSILSFRGALKAGKMFTIKNVNKFTLSGGFLVDVSMEKYPVNYIYASEDANQNIYLNIYTDVNLGSSSTPDLSQFIDIGVSNLVANNVFFKKLSLGVRLSGKLLCNCGGGSNIASARYFDSNQVMYYSSFDDKKTSLLLYASYPLF